MAKIKVQAKKDFWYSTEVGHDKGGIFSTSNGKYYKKGEVVEIDEKDFSDWNHVIDTKKGGRTVRGAMVQVEEKVLDGKVQYVEVKREAKAEAPAKKAEPVASGKKSKSSEEDPI